VTDEPAPAAGLAPLVCITGPTASGKSSLAMEVAEALPAEILCVDSMQVYRGFDIGTAKPSAQDQHRIPHHGLDLVEPSDQFDAGAFLALARELVAQRRALGREVLAVGGSGLYLRALLYGLAPSAPADQELREGLRLAEQAEPGSMHRRLAQVDPDSAQLLHGNDLVRIERALEVFLLTGQQQSVWLSEHGFGEASFAPIVFAIRWPRDRLRERIARRVTRMFDAGWGEEVRALLEAGVTDQVPAMRALGYREVSAMVRGELGEDEARARTTVLCQQFAKRQTTWFNRVPSIHWLDPEEDMTARVIERSRSSLAGAP
jgi:tRNA dimethylallyltransferase